MIVKCAHEVQPLMQAVAADDQDRIAEIEDRILEKEAKADTAKHQLRDFCMNETCRYQPFCVIPSSL